MERIKLLEEQFLTKLHHQLNSVGINVESLRCDHLCFRVESPEEYQHFKRLFQAHGTLIVEAMVNGRAISTFVTNRLSIPTIELPSPKHGEYYKTGFEHAEFVIAESFDEFKAKYPHLDFIIRGNYHLNPELCLKLNDDIQVKFHHLPLRRVIEIEEAKITDIIFDLDGTLINSMENILEINKIVFSKILKREVTIDESIKKFHPGFSGLFESFLITCPIQKAEIIAEWGNVSSKMNYKLFEGVNEGLQSLTNKNIKLHLWTARDEYSARIILKEHSIENLFATMSFANADFSKPHTNSLFFDWRNAPVNSFLVLGDSISDMQGGTKINAIRTAALWDNTNEGSLIKAGAELMFKNFKDFVEWVK